MSCEVAEQRDPTELPVSGKSGESSLMVNDAGQLVASWIEEKDNTAYFKYAVQTENGWTNPQIIASGDDWFINWADFPAISANGELWFAHFLQKSSSETFSYDVMFVISQDGGQSWTEPQKLHDDNILAEHGFVAATPYKDGFYVTWLDGRNSSGGGHDHDSGHGDGAMSIRAAFMSAQGNVSNRQELDHKTCDCCQTHIAVVEGQPVVVYRDRSDAEVRDVSFAVLQDTTWTSPSLIHSDDWHIAGCPVNGPRIVVNGQQSAVVWFTGADDDGTVKVALSANINDEFSEPIILERGTALGRVDALANGDELVLSWMGNEGDKTFVKMATLDWQGNILSQKNIIEVSQGRRTGFPRIAIIQNQLFVTYTDVKAESVKLVSVPL